MDWDNVWSVPQLSVRPDLELLVRFLGTVIAIALLRMSLLAFADVVVAVSSHNFELSRSDGRPRSAVLNSETWRI